MKKSKKIKREAALLICEALDIEAGHCKIGADKYVVTYIKKGKNTARTFVMTKDAEGNYKKSDVVTFTYQEHPSIP